MTTDRFKHIILSHQPAMQRMAQDILGNPDTAADAVQDAVVTMWQQRDKLDSVINMEAYCIQVVKRRSIDIFRQQFPTASIDQSLLESAAPPPDDTEERYQQAMKLVRQLPQRQRDAILLKYEQGKDNKEIEQSLNMSSTHLYATLSRAYRSLREMMQKQQ